MVSLNRMAKTKAHHFPVKLMGSAFVVTAVHASSQLAWDGIRAAVAEIERIEELISSWKPDSFTSRINQRAGLSPVEVPEELFHLIERSIRVSKLTFGAFDICGTLSRDYWKFDGENHACLPAEKIEELRRLTDYRRIQLNSIEKTVFLEQVGMKIGFGGIGKGYAAYRAMQVMQAVGVEDGLLNAAGDLMAWGNPPGKEFWEVHIPDPEDRTRPLLSFCFPEGSVVTSGNSQNFTIVDGKRWSHIVDPRTGMPVEELKCVSVICPNPEFGDALATAISVLGIQDGLTLVNRLNGVECLIIDRDNHKYFSDNLNLKL